MDAGSKVLDASRGICGTLPVQDPGCPASEPIKDAPCDPSLATACAYGPYEGPGSYPGSGVEYVNTYFCDPFPSGYAWVTSFVVLEELCAAPSASTVFLDTSDCACRTVSPCSCPYAPQENLDLALGELVGRCLIENSVNVTFDHTCPTSFTLGRMDPYASDCLRTALSTLRLDCAEGLSCGSTEQSTLR